ncbi:MAG: DUF3108 domain-containing protein [Kofleriaceae bacterium]
MTRARLWCRPTVMALSAAMVVTAVACGGAGTALRAGAAGPGTVAWVDGAAAEVLPPAPPPVTPGERMTYRLSVFDVEVGAYVIVVDPPAPLDDRPAIAVRSGVQSTGIAAALRKTKVDLAVWLDAATGAPLRLRAEEIAGGGDDTVEITEARFAELDGDRYPVRTSRPDAGEQLEAQVVAGTPMDITTVLMMMRRWDGEPGQRHVFDVLRSRYSWRTQVTLAGRQALVTSLGELPTVRFEAITRRLRRDGTDDPSVDVRRFSVWVSDDADRVPLLFVGTSDYGDLRMELVEYTR